MCSPTHGHLGFCIFAAVGIRSVLLGLYLSVTLVAVGFHSVAGQWELQPSEAATPVLSKALPDRQEGHLTTQTSLPTPS